MSTPTFIVGTGRCGSTLLSNLIRGNPDIASISEFYSLASDFGARYPELFPEGPITGEQYWALIGEGYPRADLMVRFDVAMPEVIYPFNEPGHRFNRETGVPLISQTTLPHLTDDFDALYDELEAVIRPRPLATVREHYIATFEWLMRRFGKRVWIERSGGIFNVMQQILDTFPEARFIHIVRDGRDTALSMASHLGFRMFVLGQFLTDCLGVDPYYDDNREKLKRVPRQYRAFLPEAFDAQAFRDFRFPLSMMGRLWSGQILRGLEVLDKVPAERMLTIRYEDLLDDPRAQLTALGEFLGEGFVDPTWLEASASVVKRPKSQWESLDEKDKQTLLSTCKPGFEALAERGVSYEGWR